ncbi:LuxR C-terminal-related transcriptional regulator [Herbiconiux sp. VKM Ac-2851]|uniref:LuxR C-terminal-related transcriptional regulator n=1 Tax=Herbiconiux sp. VKM Ac-2851 TaxID=2739025 RepID=UPI0015647558|nr:hypothetical protein [Herbiconiux sp. VKM Ac-2851]
MERPRLDVTDRLLAGGVRCATVWSGAGTGKSVLVASWERSLVERGRRVVRLTGDALAAALPADGAEVLVIDDFHLASAAHCASVFAWLEAEPEAALIVAGRFQPCPSLIDLAARGQLVELRTDDLAFTAAECVELAASHGIPLTPSMAASLVATTGGWATALALAMPVLERSRDREDTIARFVADNRAMSDYLTAEVLDACSDHERDLLLTAALGDEVAEDLVIELTGDTGAAAVLEGLAARNTLVSVGAGRIRLHPVLTAVLQAEARRRDPERVSHHHRAAARWFDRLGDGQAALTHAVASGDTGLVQRLVADHAVDLILAGHWDPVLSAIHAVPAPVGGLAEITARLLMSVPFPDRFATERLFRRADACRAARPDAYWGTLLAALHVLAARTAREADGHLAELTGAAGSAGRGLCFGLDLMCAAAEGWAGLLDGNTRWAIDRFREVADSAHHAGYTWLMLLVSVFATEAATVENNWEEAVDIDDLLLERALQHIPALADGARTAATVITAGRLYQVCLPLPHDELTAIVTADAARGSLGLSVPARGLQLLDELDDSPSRDVVDQLEDLLRSSGRAYPRLLAAAVLRLTAARLALDGRQAARDFASFAETVLGAASLELQMAHYLLEPVSSAGDAGESRLLAGANAHPRSWHSEASVAVWLLLAAHAEAAGRHVEADHRVLSAVAQAKRLRTVRPFRARNNEGVLLVQSRVGHLAHLDEYGRFIVERVRSSSKSPIGPLTSVHLTDRERDILGELPQHQSLGDIARRQHLSTNTVKTHVRSIYQKLGVSERVAAVAVARDLGLL